MRHRTAVIALVARPQIVTDTLGGAPEAYQTARITLRGLLAPSSGMLKNAAPGLLHEDTLAFLLPRDADIRPGDGVWIHSSTLSPDYRCVHCERFPLHTRALLQRRAAYAQ